MTESAMVLDEQEWEDITHIAAHFMMATQWVDSEPARFAKEKITYPEYCEALVRRRKLCNRVIDSNV